TQMLARGCRLTEACVELGRRFGLASLVLPMSDDPVRTWFATHRGPLAFQDYYVRERAAPRVTGVEYAGIEAARPSPEAAQAVGAADLVVIGPSNPVVSVWPVLRVLGAAVRRESCVAVTPVVAGAALKGPTVEMMRSLGRDPSARCGQRHLDQLGVAVRLGRAAQIPEALRPEGDQPPDPARGLGQPLQLGVRERLLEEVALGGLHTPLRKPRTGLPAAGSASPVVQLQRRLWETALERLRGPPEAARLRGVEWYTFTRR